MSRNLLFGTIMSVILLLLASCHSGGKRVTNPQFDFLDKAGITVTERLLLGDTLALPDIYRGDREQSLDDLHGESLDRDQFEQLIKPAGQTFADEMANWLLLGVRDVGNGITLAAYYGCSGAGYSVELMTYDKQGNMLDAINARELHMLWRIDLSHPDNDTVFTLDGHFTLNGNKLTLHRVMGRCVMDFDKDVKSAPFWQQQWDQDYEINAKGHFVLKGQHVVMEKGPVDRYAVLDFQTWDMLVCSRYDTSVMDVWNDYCVHVSDSYDPDYEYNPFPWDVVQLYKMNPQRFLSWMAAPQHRGNRLLPCFKLPPHDRPALLEEIGRLDDADARQWLTAIVNSWDDQPLTKHL